ncbi:SSI family serine proteinase inhibitor [Planotetraspora mira]|uniref:Subtilisin inhibitor domain-containing protein n=1 Tax=Planotetraspora mira TaxID=58121 RepID=A0A8J3TXQ1_9ACTN|nr:SSI family serine proteinase inhibitor [Planotetraspora mira]GII34543.1 hypothetical protein Pmi06nite_79850 [Planotetraspora mira]
MKPLLVLLAGTAIAAGPTAAFAGTLPPPPQPAGVTATTPVAKVNPADQAAPGVAAAAPVAPAAQGVSAASGAHTAHAAPGVAAAAPGASGAQAVPGVAPAPPGTPATQAVPGVAAAAPSAVTNRVTKIRPIATRTRALILTYAAGETSRPERYAVLNCPATSGGLRERDEACVVVNGVKGDLTQLKPSQNTFCPMMFSPVTVTANGIWDGRYVDFKHTFGNACEMHSATGTIFDI